MWTFVEVHHIEQIWGRWSALVMLSRLALSGAEGNSVWESFWLQFETEPSVQEAADAGAALAVKMNEAAADDEFEALLG